ncbi:hypothetical protein CF336_g8680, partial [Tilletia laevis]
GMGRHPNLLRSPSQDSRADLLRARSPSSDEHRPSFQDTARRVRASACTRWEFGIHLLRAVVQRTSLRTPKRDLNGQWVISPTLTEQK